MSQISVDTIIPHIPRDSGLGVGAAAKGHSGGAQSITAQAFFNGLSFGEAEARVSGNAWTCHIDGEFTPPGALKVVARDDAGKVNPGDMTIEVQD